MMLMQSEGMLEQMVCENHVHMVAFYTVFYNFVKIHKSLCRSPAMEAGIAATPMTFEGIVALIAAAAPKPGPCGRYKKRA